VDLHSWISTDLQMAKQRLEGGVVNQIPAERMHEQIDGGGIPPVYVMWHMARHHDLAVNGVLRKREEVVHRFTDRVGISERFWRGLSEGADVDLVDILDPEVVAQYALTTLDESVAWIDSGADLGHLDADAAGPAALHAIDTPADEFDWIYNMWDGKPRSWFLSWEAVGHVSTHTGELVSLRNRMGLSPF